MANQAATANIIASSSFSATAIELVPISAPDTTTPGLPAPNPGLNTNSGLGPGPGLIIASPAGVMVRFDVMGWNQGPNAGEGSNNMGNYGPVTVCQRLGSVNVSGIGDHTLTGLSIAGVQGALDVVFTTGTAAGSPQHVVAIVDQIPTPTMYLAILLDTSNRPYAVVTNSAGSIVAQSTPTGPVIPSGISLDATLVWNSLAPSVTFTVGEISYAFAPNPSVPWASFAPNWLMVGDGFGANLAFAGKIGNAQVGNFL